MYFLFLSLLQCFFRQIVSLFELEYNLILVCIEQGCEKILPYYLKHGVYKQDNSFIEGAIFVSPRGTTYNKFIEPDKSHMNTATRTLDVNGGKDQYLNMEVNKQLSLIPRCEVRFIYTFLLLLHIVLCYFYGLMNLK